MVLLQDISLSRGCWPLGIITETRQGRDGLVRTVKVKTKDSTFIRPVTKLVPLEASSIWDA